MTAGRAGGVGGLNVGGGFANPNGGFGGGDNGFSFANMFSGINDFVGGDSFANFGKLGSLALGAYGLNRSLGIQEDQLGILKDQEDRAATAQNLGTGNQLSLALQTTTPGSPEHERIKQAIASGEFQV